jgi:hypothetical protein
MSNDWNSNPTVTNCTFSENSASLDGGGMYNFESHPTISNCILWGDLPDEIYNYSGSDPIVTFSDVQGGYPSEGNIDVDPLFRDPVSDDFHLMTIVCGNSLDSPCIDAGDPAIADSILNCLHGLGTTRSDMGAYGGQSEGPVSIEDDDFKSETQSILKAFSLSQNYPNPFNPSTVIAFDIPGTIGSKQPVSLTIYDIRGRLVKPLIGLELQPGTHKIHWNGRNDRGESVASGIYLYTLRAGEERFTRKMTVHK